MCQISFSIPKSMSGFYKSLQLSLELVLLITPKRRSVTLFIFNFQKREVAKVLIQYAVRLSQQNLFLKSMLQLLAQ